MADTLIKPDPDAPGASPGVITDDDIYEDAGDLEFNPDPTYQALYLARVPKSLWEAWSKLDDDAEIQIGTIRRINHTMPDGSRNDSLHMLLSSDLAQHQGIPKEYNLDITESSVKNTFVFTESDLPGYKSKSKQKFNLASANMPARLTRPKFEKNKAPYDPNKKFTPYVRKAIPKKTTLAGKVRHEVNCVEVDNPESRYLSGLRTLDAMKPKLGTKFLNEDIPGVGGNFIQPGTISAMGSFGGFIKNKGTKAGKRPQLTKAARIAEDKLRDLLFQCFRKFNYWSMKALRAETQQPEAYLREQLEPIAVLAKSGSFATHWSLKPEFRMENYLVGETVAPGGDGDGEDSDTGMDDAEDDDDADVKFEDVVS